MGTGPHQQAPKPSKQRTGTSRTYRAAKAAPGTHRKTTTFSGLIALVRAAEKKLAGAGITSLEEQIKALRGIYYGTPWSLDFKVERSATRNTGFQVFTASASLPADPRGILDQGLFDALQGSQDVSEGDRALDFGHLIIALDARETWGARAVPLLPFGGTGLEIVTWLGDLGGGAANLALKRTSNPAVTASLSFSGTDYGASSNLEGDVAGFVVARGGSTSISAPVFAAGGIADALEAYLSPGKPGAEWRSRATAFLQMIGGVLGSAGSLRNKPAIIAKLSGQVETFACQYLASRLKDGKISTSAFRSATDHVNPSAAEVSETFAGLLEQCHQTGAGLTAKSFPAARPAAPGACSGVTNAVDAVQAVQEAMKDAEQKLRELESDPLKALRDWL